jgi:DUF2934 family protein
MAKPRVPRKTNGNASLPPIETAASANPVDANANATTKTEQKRSSRKPAIVKSDARANLVPINLEDEIRKVAYLLSERRGFEPGHETEDWLTAEVEVRQRYRQHSA